MSLLRSMTCAAMLAATMLTPSFAQAEFKLDPRFTDTNGDMVADAPSDPAKQLDPDTLIFAYTPVEDPAVYAKVWQEFLDHLAKVTGKKVQFFPVQSNAAQLEAMRAGRLHVAGFNTGSNPIAVACAGFVPFAMMAAKDGAYG
ncbi:MAG: phosphonate ABC transporter substrate-binding protein, partial [Xanthobacter sp. 17-67-6]